MHTHHPRNPFTNQLQAELLNEQEMEQFFTAPTIKNTNLWHQAPVDAEDEAETSARLRTMLQDNKRNTICLALMGEGQTMLCKWLQQNNNNRIFAQSSSTPKTLVVVISIKISQSFPNVKPSKKNQRNMDKQVLSQIFEQIEKTLSKDINFGANSNLGSVLTELERLFKIDHLAIFFDVKVDHPDMSDRDYQAHIKKLVDFAYTYLTIPKVSWKLFISCEHHQIKRNLLKTYAPNQQIDVYTFDWQPQQLGELANRRWYWGMPDDLKTGHGSLTAAWEDSLGPYAPTYRKAYHPELAIAPPPSTAPNRQKPWGFLYELAIIAQEIGRDCCLGMPSVMLKLCERLFDWCLSKSQNPHDVWSHLLTKDSMRAFLAQNLEPYRQLFYQRYRQKEPPSAPLGERYIIAFGNNHPSAKRELTELHYAAKDAYAIHRQFVRGGYRGSANQQYLLATNEEATPAALQSVIETLQNELTRQAKPAVDGVLLYLAGHIWVDSSVAQPEAALALASPTPQSPSQTDLLSATDLSRMIGALRRLAHFVVVIVDACRAGEFAIRGFPPPKVLPIPPPNYVLNSFGDFCRGATTNAINPQPQTKEPPGTLVFIASAQADQAAIDSWQDSLTQGLFMTNWLRTMAQAGAQPLSLLELLRAIIVRIEAESSVIFEQAQRSGAKQTPFILIEGLGKALFEPITLPMTTNHHGN